jgi:class 3 adenylate cyclase
MLSYQAWWALWSAVVIAAVVLIAAFGLALAAPHVKGASSFPVVHQLLGLEQTLSAPIRSVLPAVLRPRGYSNWLLLALAAAVAAYANGLRGDYRKRIGNLRAFEQFETMNEVRRVPREAAALGPIREKLERLPADAKPADREELLRLFAETKKKLDAMGRDLAFLSVDVVDSTGMKVGEEKGIIERDFREYKKLVEGKISEFGALKAAWTPDGVMICLPSVDAAVRLGQALINSLDGFNRHVKSLKRDFRIRCGVNYGYVYFDAAVPMEEMSDRVIDVAGHMQKYAEPNSIAIAKQAIEPVQVRDGFVTAGRVVDGYEVYIWPKDAPAGQKAAAAP